MATGPHKNKEMVLPMSIKLSSLKKIWDYAWPPNFNSFLELILNNNGLLINISLCRNTSVLHVSAVAADLFVAVLGNMILFFSSRLEYRFD